MFLPCILCLQYSSAEEEEEGRKRYEAQKKERLEMKAKAEEVMPLWTNPRNQLLEGPRM